MLRLQTPHGFQQDSSVCTWSEFVADSVLAWPSVAANSHCGGRLRILASIEEPAVIARILAHLEKAAGDEFQPELASLAARAPPAQPRLL
jgi:hypothetical protein